MQTVVAAMANYFLDFEKDMEFSYTLKMQSMQAIGKMNYKMGWAVSYIMIKMYMKVTGLTIQEMDMEKSGKQMVQLFVGFGKKINSKEQVY